MKPAHIVLGIFVAFLWAANFISVRIGIDSGLTPWLLTTLRFLTVALFIPFFGRPFGWNVVILLGVTHGFCQLGLSTLAISVGYSPGVSSLLIQSQVFFTILFSSIYLKEVPKINQVLGLVLSIIGICVLALPHASSDNTPILGLVLVLSAAIGWALTNLIIRSQSSEASAIGIAVWVSAVSAVPLGIGSFIFEGSPINIISDLVHPWSAVSVIFYSGIFSTLAATSIWSWLLKNYSASIVSPLSLLVPVFGFAMSITVLGEKFSTNSAIASALVLFGLILLVRPPKVLQP